MTLFPSPITVERTTGGYNAKGIWEAGTTETLTVLGSVQPLTAREALALEPEDRENGLVHVFTDSDLAVASKGSDNDGDVVVWQGVRYRLVVKDPYTNGLIPHIRYRAKLTSRA